MYDEAVVLAKKTDLQIQRGVFLCCSRPPRKRDPGVVTGPHQCRICSYLLPDRPSRIIGSQQLKHPLMSWLI